MPRFVKGDNALKIPVLLNQATGNIRLMEGDHVAVYLKDQAVTGIIRLISPDDGPGIPGADRRNCKENEKEWHSF